MNYTKYIKFKITLSNQKYFIRYGQAVSTLSIFVSCLAIVLFFIIVIVCKSENVGYRIFSLFCVFEVMYSVWFKLILLLYTYYFLFFCIPQALYNFEAFYNTSNLISRINAFECRSSPLLSRVLKTYIQIYLVGVKHNAINNKFQDRNFFSKRLITLPRCSTSFYLGTSYKSIIERNAISTLRLHNRTELLSKEIRRKIRNLLLQIYIFVLPVTAISVRQDTKGIQTLIFL